MEKTIPVCAVCGTKLDVFNVAKWQDGNRKDEVRTDSNGKLWCQPCTDEFDNIEWE